MRTVKNGPNSDFLKNNAIYFSAAIAVGALNYLYYPVLGRMLNPSAFGEVQTLVSLFLQINTYLIVMGLVTIHLVANRSANDANHVVSELERLAIIMSIGLLALAVVFSPVLKRFFQFESALPFVLLAVAVVISVPYMIRSAFVNGKRLFALNAWSSITAAGGKLVLSAILVAIGLGTVGALFGIVLAQIVALALATFFAVRHGFADKLFATALQKPDMEVLKPELRYAGFVLICSLAITLLYSVDIIIVKHYFDPHTAGLYASVSTVARLLFFLTVPVSQVLMPSVRLGQVEENIRTLVKSLVLVIVVGGLILAAFWLMPEYIVTKMMGQDYREYAQLLPRLGLAAFMISVLNLATTYYMALKVYQVAIFAGLGLGITYFLMIRDSGSLSGMVDGLVLGVGLTTIIFAFWMGSRASKLILKRRGHG